MPREALLFWLVYLGFLLADNILLLDPQADAASLRRRGRLEWAGRTRLDLLGRQAVCMNPLDPFDRLVASTGTGDRLSAACYRGDRHCMRALAGATWPMACCGTVCLWLTLALALLSAAVGFEAIAAPLLLVHGSSWLLMAVLALRAWRRLPGLGPGRWWFVLEALLVPAAVVNGAKRLCARVQVQTPPLALAMRAAARPTAAPRQRELLAYTLAERLTQREEMSSDPQELALLRRMRQCLPSS